VLFRSAAPGAVLRAITGMSLDAAALRAALTGCADPPEADAGRTGGADWRIVAGPGTEIYLHRERGSPWRVAAIVHRNGDEWRAEYRDYQDGLPRSVRMISRDGRRFDLRLALSQVEINAPLEADVFRVQIPRGAAPITIRELEEAGPLRGAPPSKGAQP